MQQNWQQQQGNQLPVQVQTHHQQNFFDNIPSSTQYQPTPAPHSVRNNNLKPIAGDSWGEWDDWNQAESKSQSDKSLVGDPGNIHPISKNFNQSESKISNNLEMAQSGVNFQWQSSQFPSRANMQSSTAIPPLPFLPTAAPPPFQSMSNSTISTQSAALSLHKENISTIDSFEPRPLENSPSILVPTPIVNTNKNQEATLPDNLEVFSNIENAQITLPNSHGNSSAPELHQMDSMNKTLQNPSTKRLHQSATNAIQSTPSEVSTMTNIGTGQITPHSATFTSTETLEDRKRFLNQEDLTNERDRFLNQSERQEHLLPPPIAYQQQSTASDDRNQYLQTSHLSEDDFVVLNNPSNDDDVNLPPPGLSRFVLGEPERTADSERHADGEDEDAIQPPPTNISSETSRNVYSFPPSSIEVQRVVTGVESITISQPTVAAISQQVESREIDLDGENIEDQQVAKLPREEPSIGGDPSSNDPIIHIQASPNIPKLKTLSNSSTGNESDHHRNNSKRYSSRTGKTRKRFDSDDSEGTSEREKLRAKEKDNKRRNPLPDSDDGEFSRQRNYKKREENSGHSNR